MLELTLDFILGLWKHLGCLNSCWMYSILELGVKLRWSWYSANCSEVVQILDCITNPKLLLLLYLLSWVIVYYFAKHYVCMSINPIFNILWKQVRADFPVGMQRLFPAVTVYYKRLRFSHHIVYKWSRIWNFIQLYFWTVPKL